MISGEEAIRKSNPLKQKQENEGGGDYGERKTLDRKFTPQGSDRKSSEGEGHPCVSC